VDSILHNRSRGVHKGAYQATAGGGLWLQVEDQGAAYQTEPETRRDERNQHSGREAGKDN